MRIYKLKPANEGHKVMVREWNEQSVMPDGWTTTKPELIDGQLIDPRPRRGRPRKIDP